MHLIKTDQIFLHLFIVKIGFVGHRSTFSVFFSNVWPNWLMVRSLFRDSTLFLITCRRGDTGVGPSMKDPPLGRVEIVSPVAEIVGKSERVSAIGE